MEDGKDDYIMRNVVKNAYSQYNGNQSNVKGEIYALLYQMW